MENVCTLCIYTYVLIHNTVKLWNLSNLATCMWYRSPPYPNITKPKLIRRYTGFSVHALCILVLYTYWSSTSIGTGDITGAIKMAKIFMSYKTYTYTYRVNHNRLNGIYYTWLPISWCEFIGEIFLYTNSHNKQQMFHTCQTVTSISHKIPM